jgi:hypothetical protein
MRLDLGALMCGLLSQTTRVYGLALIAAPDYVIEREEIPCHPSSG